MTAAQDGGRGVAADNDTAVDITIVSSEAQVQRLLPLMRAYCDFYDVAPSDESLLSVSRALIADPTHEGVQLLAADRGRDVGFATIYWSWETTTSGRIGVMNDLYVDASARGRGVGSSLIEECVQRARAHGAVKLVWQTAVDNLTAQRVYDNVGATRETWIDYWLDTR
jgi:GNAT superfamily N-acetyltransferase